MSPIVCLADRQKADDNAQIDPIMLLYRQATSTSESLWILDRLTYGYLPHLAQLKLVHRSPGTHWRTIAHLLYPSMAIVRRLAPILLMEQVSACG